MTLSVNEHRRQLLQIPEVSHHLDPRASSSGIDLLLGFVLLIQNGHNETLSRHTETFC
jgi:hypothetical protein